MITGFNTDVEYDGRVYHVQTEDKGRGNPTIESLVYVAGEILTARRSSYGDRLVDPAFGEPQILERMEAQHHTLIRDIRNGHLDPEGAKPFGYNIISNRSLDEVVLEFLASAGDDARVRLEVEDRDVLVMGRPSRFVVRVLGEADDAPIAGAAVKVKLLTAASRPTVLFEGRSDAAGRLAIAFDVPAIPEGAGAAILIQANAAGRNAELKQLVRRPGGSPA